MKHRPGNPGLSISQRSAPSGQPFADGLDRSCGYRSLALRLLADGTPESLDEKTRSVEVVAATETPVPVMDWDRYEVVNEILLMSGLELPASRQVILLDSHYRGDSLSVIGSARDLKVSGSDLLARAHFSNAPEGESPYGKLREGHLTDFSVGYRVLESEWVQENQTATIGGRKFVGPVKVVTRWKILELSVCPIGADELAKARASNPKPQNKEKAMDPKLRAFLERRGLAKDASEADAERFMIELEAREEADNGQPDKKPSAEEVEKIRSSAVGEERGRISEIDAMCKRFGCDELAGQMIAGGITVDAARAKILDHIEKSHKPGNSLGFRVEMGPDERDKFRAAATDSLLLRGAVSLPKGRKLVAGADELAGLTMRELARHALVRAGERVPNNPMEMVGRALTSSDLPIILGNTANLSLAAGYQNADETWMLWCGTGTVSNFLTHTAGRPGETDDLVEIPAGSPYKYGTRDEASEQYNVVTFGRLCAITRQAIINDQLGALTDTPYAHGESANRKIGDVAYAVLTANANMGDGKALFVSGHANLAGSGGKIGVATMDAGSLAMQTQKDIKGKRRLNIKPSFLLAPVAQKGAAEVFFKSDKFSDANTAATDSSMASTRANPYSGDVITRIYESRLDDDSTTAWYLAGPQGKFVKVFFLNGVQLPYLEVQQGWNVDGVEYKVRIDVGAKAMDWRTAYKNPGA